ncbi:MAG TPA: aldehyde dehydrogenase (NADP(+)) [Vicinamibacterales bacterium]|jgi:NADP-dependent aldehyde dehydrogenase|nr:aldehyde dehydrogenase (NADP(+)) [Vicinamibacterales bacterium]
MTTFTAVDPRTGRPGQEQFEEATLADVRAAAARAARAFRAWRAAAPGGRARFLRSAADRLEASRATLVATADGETGLGAARLNGELDRTTAQLRAFADIVDEGSFVEAIISPADPSAKPPRPDVRRMLVPIGPVAVFTPSNFPLAFGVAGGDTASALAAGCPVVVKGHPSHPATSAACAEALRAAGKETGMPDGVIDLLQARGLDAARALVTAPEMRAVAFTGSLSGGRAIHDLAASRPEPIPVFAEMGSLNPVFIAPGAFSARSAEIAEGLANSITLGTGQFCTKPGVVFVPSTDASGRAFAAAIAERVAARAPGLMLNPQLHAGLKEKLERTRALPGVEILGGNEVKESGALARPGVIMTTDLATFTATPALREEYFGPVSVIVRCPSAESLIDVAGDLEGSLTATIHADAADSDWASRLSSTLTDKAGRIVWNGYPTGVVVVWGMQHGGPYPATTSAGHTSVGATAIRRFLRPVAFQSTPDALLPEPLRAANPLGIQRLVDGRWTKDPA